MKKKQFEELEDRLRTIKDYVDGVYNSTILTNVILTLGLSVLIIFAWSISDNVRDMTEAALPLTFEEDLTYVGEGYIQRIGVDSIMVNDKIYNGICDKDLELLRINDNVFIEDAVKVDGWWNACDNFRVTISKSQLTNKTNHYKHKEVIKK